MLRALPIARLLPQAADTVAGVAPGGEWGVQESPWTVVRNSGVMKKLDMLLFGTLRSGEAFHDEAVDRLDELCDSLYFLGGEQPEDCMAHFCDRIQGLLGRLTKPLGPESERLSKLILQALQSSDLDPSFQRFVSMKLLANEAQFDADTQLWLRPELLKWVKASLDSIPDCSVAMASIQESLGNMLRAGPLHDSWCPCRHGGIRFAPPPPLPPLRKLRPGQGKPMVRR